MSEEVPPSSLVGENDSRDEDLRQQVQQLQEQVFDLRKEIEELRQLNDSQRFGDISLGGQPAPVNPKDYLGEKEAHQTPAQFSGAGFHPATQPTDSRPQPYVPPEIQEIMDRLERVEQRIPSPQLYPNVFWAKVAGNVAANGTAALREQFNDSTGLVDYTDSRWGNTTSNISEINGRGGAANGTNVLVLAYENANTTQYSYLTIDSIKWIKITGISSGNVSTGTIYNGVTPSGANVTCQNTFEPVNGSPGPLGINVSGGMVGNCTVASLGNTTSFLPAYTDSNGTNWVSAPNSAQ